VENSDKEHVADSDREVIGSTVETSFVEDVVSYISSSLFQSIQSSNETGVKESQKGKN